MDVQPGKIATRLYVALLGAVALASAGWLVMLVTGGSQVALLAMIVSAPGWGLGIMAAVELGAIARGRQVRTSRALAWGALMLGGGLVLASLGGQLTVLATLLTQPQRAGLGWSAVYLDAADEHGVYSYYRNMPSSGCPCSP